MSAGLLGTERVGHGVRIRDDGLIATIGYVVHEAENLWIGTRDTVVPGFVIGYDFDSGLALVKPSLPLHGPSMQIGRADSLAVGDAVTVVSSGGKEQSIEARVVAKQEFAGRWEYVLDQAVFTTPPHDSWSGAALVDRDGRLCGLGSLVIQGFETRSRHEHGQHVRADRAARADRRRDLPARPPPDTAAPVARHARA